MAINEGDSDSKAKGVKIVDRRRFDSSGDEKTDSLSQFDNSGRADNSVQDKQNKTSDNLNAQAASTLGGDGFIMEESDEIGEEGQEHSAESPISFGSFVLSLATQALMQLGQLPAPDGMTIPVDPAAAQQTIDVLAMLQSKTKGNLDAREEGLLRDALHNLRVAFLRFR